MLGLFAYSIEESALAFANHTAVTFPSEDEVSSFGVSASLAPSGAQRQELTEQQKRQITNALRLFRAFVAFVEFCVQFTLILGLSYLVLGLFSLPFIALAVIVYGTLTALAWGYNYPNLIKMVENVRRQFKRPPLTSLERRQLLGSFILGFIFNLMITTVVLAISTKIVGAQMVVGSVDLGSSVFGFLGERAVSLAGYSVASLVVSIFFQAFSLKTN